MSPKEFHDKYYEEIIQILDRFSQVEGQRIAKVIEMGNHYNMNDEKEHIEILAKARMIRSVSVSEDSED